LQSNYRKRDEVFVALDEIINCAPIPKFIDTLNTMRSAKMPTFLYLQALEGLIVSMVQVQTGYLWGRVILKLFTKSVILRPPRYLAI
jgi:hypothetical protein